MIWINFLHLYQPANVEPETIQEATEKSYWRLVTAMEKNPGSKMTFNINGCLVERWQEMGYGELIGRIAKLQERGQLELVGTAAYHPIIPLIPANEAEAQIRINEEIISQAFGLSKKPRGFFFPEMAYSPEAGKTIKKLGYEWVILDEILGNGKIKAGRIYKDEINGLKIVFRSRRYSHSYVPESIRDLLENKTEDQVVTGTDGELYGLRHDDPGHLFEKVLQSDNLETKTVSEFVDSAQTPEIIQAWPGSWESTSQEIKSEYPFRLWQNPDNQIHKLMWELANLAIKTANKHAGDDNYYWARRHLMRGLASCSFWWASEKDFAHIYGPKAWNPDEIERGVNELIRSVRALDDEITRQVKVRAEGLYIEIKRLVWERHWKYHWKHGSHAK
jgi:predicted glycosyl hydrolase (DUF1957 family)